MSGTSTTMIIDIWFIIFENIKLWDDALKVRSVNTSANEAFYEIIKTCKKYTFPRRTFIQIDTCMCCEKSKDNIHQVVYNHDTFPERRLYFCESFTCFAASLKRYFDDMNTEKIFPFVRFDKKNIWITRSNGGYSVGNITKNVIKKHNDKWFVDVVFEDKTYKDRSVLYDKLNNNPNLSHHKLIELVTIPSDIIHFNYIFGSCLNNKAPLIY